jgi:hypothetical protein
VNALIVSGFQVDFLGSYLHSGDGEMLKSWGKLVATDRQYQYDRSPIAPADWMADSHIVIVLTDIVFAGF